MRNNGCRKELVIHRQREQNSGKYPLNKKSFFCNRGVHSLDKDLLMGDPGVKANIITIAKSDSDYSKGDDALIALFRKENYDAVATDDAKLTRLLRIKGIPFILPGLIMYKLLQDNLISRKTALRTLKQLAEFISEDEYSTARLLMEKTE
jgi:hypothetical protein